jgi:hypothetical protein
MNTGFQTVIIRFPNELRNNFNFSDYSLYGYLQGERCDKCNTLSIHHFESIEIIHESENAVTKEKFIHAIGYLNNKKSILIFKKK